MDQIEVSFLNARHNNNAHLTAICNVSQRCVGCEMSLSEVRAILARHGYHAIIALTPFTSITSIPLGFAIYEILPHEIAIRSLVVIPDARRNKVATDLFGQVSDKLDDEHPEISVTLDEDNLDGLRFLRALNKSICDGAFGSFRLTRQRGGADQIRFSFAPIAEEAFD